MSIEQPIAEYYENVLLGLNRKFSLFDANLVVESRETGGTVQKTPIPLNQVRPEYGTSSSRQQSPNATLSLFVVGMYMTVVGVGKSLRDFDLTYFVVLLLGLALTGLCIRRWAIAWRRVEKAHFFAVGTVVAFTIAKNQNDHGEFISFVQLMSEKIRAANESK